MRPLLSIGLGSLLALSASALLLLLGFALYQVALPANIDSPPEAVHIPGSSMRAVLGGAQARGEQLAFTRYEAREDEYHAIAVWQGRVATANYAFLRYQLDAPQAPQSIRLFWRTAEKPEGFFIYDVYHTVGKPRWLELSTLPDWEGTVVEIGMLVFVVSPDQELAISGLTLEPGGLWPALSTYWSDWTNLRGWSASSINTLLGTSTRHVLSPVYVVAAWAGLAAVLLALVGLFVARARQPGTFVAVLLLPWLALDLLWQRELSAQLAATEAQFAGKTAHEKHLADVDADIYQYVDRLKQAVLPSESARVLLLHQSRGHNFDRLKAQYYLLPHNVYNLTQVPPDNLMGNVDYIIELGNVRKLRFIKDRRVLVWRGSEGALPVELVDEDPMGTVYRVLDRNAVEGKQP